MGSIFLHVLKLDYHTSSVILVENVGAGHEVPARQMLEGRNLLSWNPVLV